jgi:translocation and assembly module TamA
MQNIVQNTLRNLAQNIAINRVFLLILLFVIPPFALSGTLVVQLSDKIPRDLKQNIHAYLGKLPSENDERPAFIFTAKKKTLNALNALGYYRAVVTNVVNKDEDKDIWTLSINVALNEPTLIKKLNIIVTGDASKDSLFSEFIRDIPVVSGDILHHGVYEKVKEDLISLGLERGYFDIKFTKSNIALHKNLKTADIILHLDSGNRYQFGEISFNYVDINADILKPLIPFNTGDFYQQNLLQSLQNGLDETQYFSNVVVWPNTGKVINNILPIDVSLDKAKRHQLDLGLGYTTDTKENFSFGWKTPLVNRYGHRQETKLSYSKINPTGYFIYGIPLSHPNNDVLQLKTILEENDFADLTSKFLSFQVGRVYLKEDMLRQPYIRHLSEEWNTDGIADDAKYYIPGFTWSDKEWKGSVLDPTKGFRQYYNLEGSYEKFNSKTSFLRFNARWKYISLLAPKHRLVTRAEVGYAIVKSDIEAKLSPSLRFYAGGDQSIRGFAYQSIGPTLELTQGDNASEKIVLGGTNIVVASVEYQYYFSNEWRGALFTDGGSVNDKDKLDFVYSIGTGIHYISPIGPIRFALGYPISEDNPSWRVHFSIGAEL